MNVEIKLNYPPNDARNLEYIESQLDREVEWLKANTANEELIAYSDLYVFLSVAFFDLKYQNGGICFNEDILSPSQLAWLKDLGDRFHISEEMLRGVTFLWVSRRDINP